MKKSLFLVIALVFFTGLAAPLFAQAVGSSYSVAVLGDLHYDSEPAEKFHGKGFNGEEYQRNKAMWEEETPAILAASAKCVGPDTAFVLQLGDLIQGQTKSYAAHTQMLAEATSVLKSTYPTLPVISIAGNHDVLGNEKPGRAYRDYMLPWQTTQLAPFAANAITNTTFGFRPGEDLWICINFNNGVATVPIVKKLLEDNPDVRYTFVTTHGPVLPMDIWKRRWFYLGGDNAPANRCRRKMRALFAKRNAIVLSGHVHSLEYKDWYGDGGRITEMVLNSVPRNTSKMSQKPAVPHVYYDTPDTYGMWLKTAETNAANTRFEALYEEYRPGLKSRFAARAVGHHILRVSDSGVVLEYYGRDATAPTKTFSLR